MFLGQLTELANLIERGKLCCNEENQGQLFFLTEIEDKIDNLAFLFVLGPFVQNQHTSYTHHIDFLCDIIRSIELHQKKSIQTKQNQQEEIELFLDISCMLKKMCKEISLNSEIMKI